MFGSWVGDRRCTSSRVQFAGWGSALGPSLATESSKGYKLDHTVLVLIMVIINKSALKHLSSMPRSWLHCVRQSFRVGHFARIVSCLAFQAPPALCAYMHCRSSIMSSRFVQSSPFVQSVRAVRSWGNFISCIVVPSSISGHSGTDLVRR